ncbi:MAG TPA: peptidylprolyl isomerase [Clostridiaceae bacterium]|nr:peptidylprolyl isomerase [Clostridiaceae bacterium]
MENRVLATVNDVEITSDIMNKTIEQLPPERRGYFDSEFGKKQLLDQLVNFELVNAFGLEIGVDKDQAYRTQLEQAEKEIRFNTTMNKIMSTITVTDEEAQQIYNEHPEKYKGQEVIRASHILVDSEELAVDILKKINEDGMAFEDAAMEFSSCPSKEQGGDLGEFGRGMMVPEFETAAFALDKDEMTQLPVRSQFGYHIIKTTDKKGVESASFDEVRDQVKGQMLQEKQMEYYTKLLTELREKYNVDVK